MYYNQTKKLFGRIRSPQFIQTKRLLRITSILVMFGTRVKLEELEFRDQGDDVCVCKCAAASAVDYARRQQ